MAYLFTPAEIAQLQLARSLCPPVEDSPSTSGNWTPLYTKLSSILGLRIVDGSATGSDLKDMEDVKRWLDVAIGANGGSGMHSAFIRAYTNRQGELRVGAPFSEAEMQRSSNGVALNLWRHLSGQHSPSWRVPKISEVAEMVAKLEATVPLARDREADFKRLSEQGFMSGHAGQDRTRERIELERDLLTQKARLAEAQAALSESVNARTAYVAEVRRMLHEREAQADLKRQQATQEQAKANQRERLTTLVAPVAGVVQQLVANTEGGVVTEAQSLMVIVPDGAQITAEVAMENKDVGFVNVGQAAEIKLETFPFTRYGTVLATVSRVSADAINDEKRGALFPATLTLSSTHIDVEGKRIRLSPGMNLTAEIKTGKRRVIEYLLSPVQKAGNESLRER